MGAAGRKFGRRTGSSPRRRSSLLDKSLAAIAVGLGASLYALAPAGAAPAPRSASSGQKIEVVIENVSTPNGPEPAFVGPNGVGAPVLVDLVAGTPTTITVVNKTDVPHSLTAAALGLDLSVPPGPATVHVTVDPKSPGLVTWKCDVPCGAWVMSHAGYMKGQIDVKPEGAAAPAGATNPASPATPASGPKGALKLTMTAHRVAGKAPAVKLVARLGDAGSAAGQTPAGEGQGVRVYFSLRLTEFSTSPLLALGSTTTDAAGEATLTYVPTWTGRQRLVAEATSASGSTLTAAASFVAPRASDPLARSVQAQRPDGTIGQAVVGVLLALLVVLWIVLISVVVRVNLGLGKKGRPQTES